MRKHQSQPNERTKPSSGQEPSEREVIRLTRNFKAFRSNARGIERSAEDEVQQHYLRGTWADGTLKYYNSVVLKLLRFAEVKQINRELLLPISGPTLKSFIVWTSKKQEQRASDDESVSSSTIKAYIAGIRAWHLFHDEKYPNDVDLAVSGLLKASKKIEAEFKERDKRRPPVLISDLAILLEELPEEGEKGRAVLALALTAFWGTARLGELISDNEEKQLPTWEDVSWGPNGSFVKITIKGAKTAGPGEHQYICLSKQESKLDPVRALENWFWFRERKLSEEIFTLKTGDSKTRMKKRETITYLRNIWNKHRPPNSQMLFGHSFRIGGASLRWNLGASRDELKVCGRWKSDTYKIYLRKFTTSEMRGTVKLLKDLQTKH